MGKTTLLKLITGELQPLAGEVSVNGTVDLLKQMVRASQGETVADLFGATDALAIVRRAKAGEASVEELAETDWAIRCKRRNITSA